MTAQLAMLLMALTAWATLSFADDILMDDGVFRRGDEFSSEWVPFSGREPVVTALASTASKVVPYDQLAAKWKNDHPPQSSVQATAALLPPPVRKDDHPDLFLIQSHLELADLLSEQPSRGLKGVSSQAIHALQNLLPATQPSISVASRCAVVGSSGSLEKSGLGSEIDAHALVFRFNQAPLQGFEPDVGSKTSFRFCHESSFNHSEGTFAAPIIFVGHMNHSFDFISKQLASHPDIRVLNPAFVKHTRAALLNNQVDVPSTGFLGIAVALEVCKQIDVYGFGSSRSKCAYYWDCGHSGYEYAQRGPEHGWVAEARARRHLNDTGAIRTAGVSDHEGHSSRPLATSTQPSVLRYSTDKGLPH